LETLKVFETFRVYPQWKGMGRTHTKTVVVVEIVDVVVAVSTAGVPLIVVEGTAPQGAAFVRSAPPP